MKNTLSGLILALFLLTACNNSQTSSQATADNAQSDTTEEPVATEEASNEESPNPQRVSPPKTATGTIDGIEIKIDYSSPSVKGRKIWGKLVPFNEVWRTGANEATTISLSKTASIEGKTLAAGKYSLFTIPGEEKWTVIFNTVAEQWGAYEYDKSKDALRVQVTPEMLEEPVEMMEFSIEEGKVILRWEKLALPIKVALPEAG
ncbi:MAG: DUF2911 domain-containing protein [Phaeodactylibacter sp.]|nr:DUF2911 domain-containing protein [Phaeodactylibacter sp.]MCB9267032.1 DUF2911 domain-containing protein [Lewinellaceae bacterium]MCB9289317.1 DUF2911 domain-containing protein [Lewinellaceae bacterium]